MLYLSENHHFNSDTHQLMCFQSSSFLNIAIRTQRKPKIREVRSPSKSHSLRKQMTQKEQQFKVRKKGSKAMKTSTMMRSLMTIKASMKRILNWLLTMMNLLQLVTAFQDTELWLNISRLNNWILHLIKSEFIPFTRIINTKS